MSDTQLDIGKAIITVANNNRHLTISKQWASIAEASELGAHNTANNKHFPQTNVSEWIFWSKSGRLGIFL